MKICPECSRHVPDMAERCECGYSFAPEPAPPEDQAKPRPDAAAQAPGCADEAGAAAESAAADAVADLVGEQAPVEDGAYEEAPEETEEFPEIPEEEPEAIPSESFDDLPEGPMEEMPDHAAVAARAVAAPEVEEHKPFVLFRTWFLALVAANCVVLALVVYFLDLRFGRVRVEKKLQAINSKPVGGKGSEVQHVTDAGSDARKAEDVLAGLKLNCEIAEIIRTTGELADVRVELRKETAWDMDELRTMIESDAAAIIRATFSSFSDVQQVTVRATSRVEGELAPKWAKSFEVVALRKEHEQIDHNALSNSAALARFKPYYHPRLANRE